MTVTNLTGKGRYVFTNQIISEMLQRIETSEVMKRAGKFFDDHNANCPIIERISRRKQGDIPVKRRQGLIHESLTKSFHVILTEYVLSYNRTAAIMPEGMYTMDDLPSMHTTHGRLAKYCRCSSRNVQNHIDRLQELDMIRTKFHGDKKAYELWINPKFLFEIKTETKIEIGQKTPEMALEGENAKIFPHKRTHREILEKEKKNADKLINQLGVNNDGESNREKGRTDVEGIQPLNEWVEQQGGIKTGGAAAAQKSDIVAQNDQIRRQKATEMLEARMPGMPKGLDAKYWQMLMNFWLYAWKVVYTHRKFTKVQQEKALVAIAAGVFNNFVDKMDDKQWFEYYQFQMAKLDKAARHYDNHPLAYKPDPYAVVIPGKGYFDYENVKGFVGIDAWIKKDSLRNAKKRMEYAEKQEEKMKRCEALLRTARRDFEKMRQEMKPRKEVTGKNQIALFQYYNVIFAGMGTKWQEKFCEQYLDQQARDFQPPKYLKAKRSRQMADQMPSNHHPATIVNVDDLERFGLYDGDGYEVHV